MVKTISTDLCYELEAIDPIKAYFYEGLEKLSNSVKLVSCVSYAKLLFNSKSLIAERLNEIVIQTLKLKFESALSV